MQLLVYVAHVVAHRLVTDPELVGDLFVGHARCQQLQDLHLSAGQTVVKLLRSRRASKHVKHAVRDSAGHHPLTSNHRYDARHHRGRPRILEYGPAGTSSQSLENIAVGIKAREHEHLRPRVVGHNVLGRLYAVTVRHFEVHKHNVWLKGGALLDRIRTIDSQADDFYPRISRQNLRQPNPEERLIVGDQHASRPLLSGRLDAHSIASIGNLTEILVPLPGRLSRVSVPPRRRARSFIPSMPIPPRA